MDGDISVNKSISIKCLNVHCRFQSYPSEGASQSQKLLHISEANKQTICKIGVFKYYFNFELVNVFAHTALHIQRLRFHEKMYNDFHEKMYNDLISVLQLMLHKKINKPSLLQQVFCVSYCMPEWPALISITTSQVLISNDQTLMSIFIEIFICLPI